MSWFVDASALVALAGLEADWAGIAEQLDSDADRFWSAVSRWEAISGTRKRLDMTLEEARDEVDRIAKINGLEMIPIGPPEAEEAVDAMRRYGRGSGSRTKLNMGDCFAYACARTNGARLLYKGDDFVHTDMAL